MERQLGFTSKLGGREFMGISRAEHIVLARLMESQKWHQPAGSVTLLGEGLEKGYCLPFCLGESCPPALTLVPGASVSCTGEALRKCLLGQISRSLKVSLLKGISIAKDIAFYPIKTPP